MANAPSSRLRPSQADASLGLLEVFGDDRAWYLAAMVVHAGSNDEWAVIRVLGASFVQSDFASGSPD